MANPLYNEQMNQNFLSQFAMFRKNPLQFLLQRNVNIPPQYANDPKGAVQYMVSNGLMSQEQLANFKQMAQTMGMKLN